MAKHKKGFVSGASTAQAPKVEQEGQEPQVDAVTEQPVPPPAPKPRVGGGAYVVDEHGNYNKL